MSILDMFRSAPTNATTNATTTTDPAAANNTVPGALTQRSDGSNPAIPAAKEGDANPLAEYSKLFEAKDPTPTAQSLVPTITGLDAESMMKAARTFDFTKGINTDDMQAAAKGDPSALAKVINQAAQAGFVQAATASTNITSAALAAQSKQFSESYAPAMLRNDSINRDVANNIDLASNPATKPLVDMVTKQVSAANPTATPAEVTAHVNKYLAGMAAEVVRAQGGSIYTKEQLELTNSRNPLSRKEEDWTAFFGEAS